YAYQTPEACETGGDSRAAHWRQGDRGARAQPDQPAQAGGWAPSGVPPAGGEEQFDPQPPRRSRLQNAPPPQHAEPRFASSPVPPQPQPEPQLPPQHAEPRFASSPAPPPQHAEPRFASSPAPPQPQPE